MRSRLVAVLTAVLVSAVVVPVAAAAPVATNQGQYDSYGRVFPDPLAGCQNIGPPCSPNAQGNVQAFQFIGIDEFVDGIRFMNSKPEWQRYLEVWPLDGKMDDGATPQAGTDPKGAFPGNTLSAFEFTPRPEYRSVGIPTTGTGRRSSDLYVLRVTDESVPDAGKKRYAVALSIHGIERAGVEGGTRAVEDLVTAATTGRSGQRIVPDGTIANAPTFAEVLRRTIVYFVYPNPDGWRRGSIASGPFGGAAFQRYNGNGVDLNRDWPDVGFAFRPYSALSEPESRAFAGFFADVTGKTRLDAAADLHGQLTADALSYTLIGHGRHDFDKDLRIRETAKAIHRVSEKSLSWSPMIVPNATPRGDLACQDQAGLTACARIYGQTWGTVYDTINYTTTGAMADWLDSPVGANADGIDNEMSFSHVDRNTVFEKHGEQLHVDGNKALIYAQLANIVNPARGQYGAPGRKGFVASARLKRADQTLQPKPPAGTVAQARIDDGSGTPGPGTVEFGFPVKVGPQPAGGPDGGKNIFNGGLRVDVTKLNAQGLSDANAVTRLLVQCRFCDDHPGVPVDDDEWVTVAEDFNQGPIYQQAGLTAAVNRPLAKNRNGRTVEWRALLEARNAQTGAPIPNAVDAGARFAVEFFQGPATVSRDTAGFNPPRLRGYDVANTDVFADLNKSIPTARERFGRIDQARVAAGRQSLDGYTSIVLADQTRLASGFLDKLQDYVRGGGNLVLTDGSLRLLPEFVDLDARDVNARKLYVGQVSFMTKEGESDASAVKDPLLTRPQTVVQQGARFNSNLRRQTYEPTPLGYAIQYTDVEEGQTAAVGDDKAESPGWDVDREAFERAGGRTIATAVEAGDTGADAELDRAAMGEARVGSGRVRFVGALLPQPTQRFDHDFGLEPYALTYTGHILLRNALEWPARPAGAGARPSPRACTAANGFRRASVRRRGRGLRISFTRRVRQPITVDVFQNSTTGRRIVGERLVARFRARRRAFTWNGRANRGRKRVTDGYFFVRMRMPLGRGRTDTRRFTLRRSGGRFRARPPHHRRESCGLVNFYKLERPVFGGRFNQGVDITYKLTRTARVTVTVLRGRRVVRRYRTRERRPFRSYRQRFDAEGRPRGDYRFRITAVATRGGRKVTATLVSRRL
jgi:hypothetical protein